MLAKSCHVDRNAMYTCLTRMCNLAVPPTWRRRTRAR
jgi:hypothetical protein